MNQKIQLFLLKPKDLKAGDVIRVLNAKNA